MPVAQRAPEKTESTRECEATLLREVLSCGKKEISPSEREELLAAVGRILVALGLSSENRLPELFDAIAVFGMEEPEARQPSYAGLMREIIKRNVERDLRSLEESRRPDASVDG